MAVASVSAQCLESANETILVSTAPVALCRVCVRLASLFSRTSLVSAPGTFSHTTVDMPSPLFCVDTDTADIPSPSMRQPSCLRNAVASEARRGSFGSQWFLTSELCPVSKVILQGPDVAISYTSMKMLGLLNDASLVILTSAFTPFADMKENVLADVPLVKSRHLAYSSAGVASSPSR